MFNYYVKKEIAPPNPENRGEYETIENTRKAVILDTSKLESWRSFAISPAGNFQGIDLFKLLGYLSTDRALIQALTISNGQWSMSEIFDVIREWDARGFIDSNGNFRPPLDVAKSAPDSYSRLQDLYDTAGRLVRLLDNGLLDIEHKEVIDGLGRFRKGRLFSFNPEFAESIITGSLIVGIMKLYPDNFQSCLNLVEDSRFNAVQHFTVLRILIENADREVTSNQIYDYLYPHAFGDSNEYFSAMKRFVRSLDVLLEQGFIEKEKDQPTYSLIEGFNKPEDLVRPKVKFSDESTLTDKILQELKIRVDSGDKLSMNQVREIALSLAKELDYANASRSSLYSISQLIMFDFIELSDGIVSEVKQRVYKRTVRVDSDYYSLLKYIQENIDTRTFRYEDVEEFLNSLESVRSVQGETRRIRRKHLWGHFKDAFLKETSVTGNRIVNLYKITDLGKYVFETWNNIFNDPLGFISIAAGERISDLNQLARLKISDDTANPVNFDPSAMLRLYREIYETVYVAAANSAIKAYSKKVQKIDKSNEELGQNLADLRDIEES